MKTAILHDFILQKGGAERVLEALLEIYPECDLYTIAGSRKIIDYPQKSLMNSNLLPQHYKYLIWHYPALIENLGNQLEKYDLIISSSWGWLKSIPKGNYCHICYLHTPNRYLHGKQNDYIKNPIVRAISKPVFNKIRKWDLKTGSNPDYYITTSEYVRKQIKELYQMDARVIHPFVDIEQFKPIDHISQEQSTSEYYLAVGRLVPQKKFDILIEAFNQNGKRLVLIGDGPDRNRLSKISKLNIEFIGHVESQEKLAEYYGLAKATIFVPEEPFGMVNIESQSCGTPVIAFAGGGALETVIDGKTGMFFDEQTPQAINKAIKKFEKMIFHQKICRDNAIKFSKTVYKKQISSYIESKYQDWVKISQN
ncbi:glycosyltransferase [Candidatus Woesearchaeota archaeon]|nr:glycosyltransferase [Candidatus Woesearchaeota archaeon]